MFAFFSVLLVLALLNFGAVEDHVYLFVAILWLAGLVGLVAAEAVAQRSLSVGAVVYASLSITVFLLDYRLSVGLVAAGWGWLAARRFPLRTLFFLRVLIIVGVLEAILGMIQYFVAPGWILGYQNPYYISSGTLINRNHFAGLLEMIVPVPLGFAFATIMRGHEVARVYFYLFLGALTTIAVIFSTSRMGLFSVLATLLLLGAILRLKASGNGSAALVFVVLGLVVAGALWIGVDVVVLRFVELGDDDAFLREGRALVYADTLRLIAANPLGIGIGAYPDVFRRYQAFRPDLLMDHAHNDYLETASEWGILPAASFWGIIVLIFVRAVRSLLRTGSPERAAILIASVGAIFSILLHSLTDFNLQVPSNAMLFFMFVGIAAAVSSPKPLVPEDRRTLL